MKNESKAESTNTDQQASDGPVSLLERINRVRKEVAYVRKTKKVQSYKGLEYDALVAEMRDSVIKHGIVFLVNEEDSKTVETGTTTASGTPIIRFEGRYSLTLYSVPPVADGINHLTASVTAHGLDSGDKAPGKAYTYATKMMLLKTFFLESGEDEESRIESRPTPISEEDYTKLVDLCEKYEFPVDETLSAMAKKVFGKKAIMDLLSSDVDSALNMLHAKGERKLKQALSAEES